MSECGNCVDGSGWRVTEEYVIAEQQRRLVWWACADCNDDAAKPKPELCESCRQTKPECNCDVESTSE